LVELLVVVAVLALLVVALLLSPPRHERPPLRARCANNLKECGIAFRIWASDRGNAFPVELSTVKDGTRELAATGRAFAHFQVLSNELATPRILICPADKERSPAKEFSSLSNTNLSYFIGLDAREETPGMLLAGDRNLTNGTPLPPNGILVLTTNTMLGWTHELHNFSGNVLLADASVQQVSSSGLRSLIVLSGGTNHLAMP